jgi:lipopolysaccharide transport system permease protein
VSQDTQLTAGDRRTPVELVLEPRHGFAGLALDELWRYRELLLFLAWRDIAVRYKQTVLGAVWAIAQPVMMTVIFTVVFGRMAGLPSEGVPYQVFSYAAALPWQFFATAAMSSAGSLLGNAGLITKVYFPRLVIPIAAGLPAVIDFAVACGIFFVLAAWFHVPVTWQLLSVPVFLLVAAASALGVGLWLSALSVEYRDVKHVVPFLMQLWLFASPVAYSSSMVPEKWRLVYALNPMAGAIEGFRWALLGHCGATWLSIVVSSVVAVLLLITGACYFRNMERTFADVV